MHVEVETRVDIHKREKHKNVFFFFLTFFHLKVNKTNATIHINFYFVNVKTKVNKQTNKKKSIAAVGAYMHNLWSTAGIIMSKSIPPAVFFILLRQSMIVAGVLQISTEHCWSR